MKHKLKIPEGYIYLELDSGEKAFVKFSIDNERLYVNSTFVPEAFRGRGLARDLLSSLIEFSKRNGLEIVPVCSYSVKYFLSHRGERGVLAEPFKSMSDEELKRYYEERLAVESSRRSLRVKIDEDEASKLDCPVC